MGIRGQCIRIIRTDATLNCILGARQLPTTENAAVSKTNVNWQV